MSVRRLCSQWSGALRPSPISRVHTHRQCARARARALFLLQDYRYASASIEECARGTTMARAKIQELQKSVESGEEVVTPRSQLTPRKGPFRGSVPNQVTGDV